MISKSMMRPVLVAGFFVWASGLGAQVDPVKPVALLALLPNPPETPFAFKEDYS